MGTVERQGGHTRVLMIQKKQGYGRSAREMAVRVFLLSSSGSTKSWTPPRTCTERTVESSYLVGLDDFQRCNTRGGGSKEGWCRAITE
ncbi:hypothetical protein CSUI_006732 [Cystoisospora suis]|uniref:Uncharacterized protein n=1 Tax=Cystoisospora suis TaxID=483139 RepID=A0A2C6KQT3_9APIC|nr:hypothetical protein CSUI_006732 [Cystoisospora suis]